MNKTLKIIISLFVFLLLLYIIFFLVMDRYNNDLMNTIKNKTDFKNILYVNKYDFNYIVLTDTDIIVLDDNYKTILKDKKNKLYSISGYYNIIYKRDILMYEVKNINKEYLIYNYYDAYTNEKIDQIKIRRYQK